MPLLKANSAHRTRESAIVMDLADLEEQARRIIAQAHAESDRILAQARDEARAEGVRLREEARQLGHREGFDAGLAEGRTAGHDDAVKSTTQSLQQLVARWSQALEIIHQNMPAHAADAKTDLIRLALAIATRVTHQEALRNRHVAEAIVADVLQAAGAARAVALHVHPGEADLLEAYLPDLLAKLRSIESVELVPDETVSPGGSLVKFGAGQIDGRIETQLQRIAEDLLAEE